MTPMTSPNLRVLEYGQMATAPYCAKLLADMGAEVIKIEQPGPGVMDRLGLNYCKDKDR